MYGEVRFPVTVDVAVYVGVGGFPDTAEFALLAAKGGSPEEVKCLVAGGRRIGIDRGQIETV